MAKYGKKAQETVKSSVERMKKGTLKSGSGKKVTNRKQAIAIGLSEAREKGAKVPPPKSSTSQRGPVSGKKTKTTRKKSASSTSSSRAKK